MRRIWSRIRSFARAAVGSRWLSTAFHVGLVVAVAGGFVAFRWIATLPARVDAQRTILVGTPCLTPDSDASLRVVVQDAADGAPVENARVEVSLAPADGSARAVSLFEGRTDEAGTLPVRFHVPADAPAEATLIVASRSDRGRDRVERPVTIERAYRVFLTTDKPLYQPGQTIHMRAVALSTFDLSAAADATVDFLVEDARGNKVYRESVIASRFGVAAADFGLADLVNQGDYVLSAAIGETRSEKTVEVRPYALPKFGVEVTTKRSFYLPGQRVEGTVQADYFFGKPVSEGEVRIVGSVWDVARTVAVELQGETDGDGGYAFSFELPEYFAGSGLESGQGQFALEVTVIDQTDHAEHVSRVLPIAAKPLLIEAVPESGVLKPGVRNIVYFLTSYPDGRPAPAALRITAADGAVTEIETGPYGLAEFTMVATAGGSQVLGIEAEDESGLSVQQQVTLGAEGGMDSVLLRADRAAYVVGETMELVALTAGARGSIYLDIVKAGQTLSTRSAPVLAGEGDEAHAGPAASFAIDVTPDMIGELELHAYKVRQDGGLVRDTRLVAVDAPRDLDVRVGADRETYLPGETALVDLNVTGEQGGGLPAALGVAVVDESVFALQRQDPGFAKLYFLLRQELMAPFVQIEGFELPASASADVPGSMREAQDRAAKASWATVSAAALSEPVDSRQEKLEAAYAAQREGFEGLRRALSVGLIVAPVALLAVGVMAVAQAGMLKRSLGRLLMIAGGLLLLGVPLMYAMVRGPYGVDFDGLLTPLAAISGLMLVAFVVSAWARRDGAAKSLALLLLGWGGLLLLLVRALNRSGAPGDGALAWLMTAVLIPGGFLLFGLGRWAERRHLIGGLATGLGSLSALPVVLVVPALISSSLMGGARFGATGAQPQLQMGGARGMWNADGAMLVEEAAPPMEGEAKGAPAAEDEASASQSAGEAPRLRQWFPETLYWAPNVETDSEGHAALEIPLADSITSWRLTALASSTDGRLGYVTHGLRVFQDFFVDIDLPVSLTEGDEISIPVGVFNYLPEAQEVRLAVEQGDWFELQGAGEKTLTIDSNDIEVVTFPIRVTDFGRRGFQVTAWGEAMSDAIRREVDVAPNGKEIRLTESDWLRESCEVGIDVPDYAVPDTSRVEVKIYPGVLAQVVEGLEKILRLPHG